MKEVSKFFGLREGDIQVCNGFVFTCTGKKVLTQGAAPTIYGTLTTPAGEVVDYTQKGVFANKLNKLAGVANSVTFHAKVDNSQQKGENKVILATLSANKQQKRFLKAWRTMLQAHRVYCPEATDIPTAMWEALKAEDNWYNHIDQIKAEQLREQMKAEAEARKAAQEEAKKRAELINTIKNEQKVLFSFGMSEAQVHTMLEQKYGAEILAEVF